MRRSPLPLLLLLAACTSAGPPHAAPTTAPPAPTSPVPTSVPPAPAPRRVVLVVMENRAFDEIVGSPSMPFLNHRIRPRAITLTDMHGDGHPSLPNYVWMMAGQNCGALTDADWGRTCRSLLDQLTAAGIGWTTYAEGYPGSARACDLVDGAGLYARKHVPPLLFGATSTGPACTEHVRGFPARGFRGLALAPFTIVIPDLCHDMHDCVASAGDAWLRTHWDALVADAGPRGTVILTWDESDGGDPPIPTFVGGEHVPGAGTDVGSRFDHSSTLRAIEDAFGLPCLAGACNARPLPMAG